MRDDQFTDYVLDQLTGLTPLRARKMFGGMGLYCGTQFFGILYQGRLFFRTHPANRNEYVARGMTPFTYERGKKIVSLNYFEVPPEVLEQRGALLEWARRALDS